MHTDNNFLIFIHKILLVALNASLHYKSLCTCMHCSVNNNAPVFRSVKKKDTCLQMCFLLMYEVNRIYVKSKQKGSDYIDILLLPLL